MIYIVTTDRVLIHDIWKNEYPIARKSLIVSTFPENYRKYYMKGSKIKEVHIKNDIFYFKLNQKESYKFPYLMNITIYVNFVIKNLAVKVKGLKEI